MLGKKRSNDAKAANRASAISAIGVQLSRYLTKRELRHPKIVTGNVNEVKNFNSLRARRYWSGYAARADRITSVLNKRPPLIKNKHNGYTYFIKLLTPKEKNVLQLEPWGAKPSIHNLYNFFCSCHYQMAGSHLSLSQLRGQSKRLKISVSVVQINPLAVSFATGICKEGARLRWRLLRRCQMRASSSSRGLGHSSFTAETRVQFSLEMKLIKKE